MQSCLTAAAAAEASVTSATSAMQLSNMGESARARWALAGKELREEGQGLAESRGEA
jgi:hypothetical protein